VERTVPFFRHWLCLLSFGLFLSIASQAQTINIYAAPDGTDASNGQDANTPVSLSRAKAVAKGYPQNPCVVWLKRGVYPAFVLDASDNRSAAAPVTYRSIDPNGAVFQPEVSLNRADFRPLPDEIKDRIIDPTAKANVQQLDLTSYGFSDTAQWPLAFGIAKLKTPKFYQDGYPLPMSRYPSDTTMTMREVVDKGTTNSNPGGSFKYRDDRGKYWLKAIDDGGLYLSGNWQTPWQMDVMKTLSLTTSDSLIVQSAGILNGLGTQAPGRIAAGAEPYYALNLVEEIAKPGQWSINFKTKTLYMWVPATGLLTAAGNSKKPAISVTGVSNTNLIGIAVLGGSGNGIELRNCNNVLVAGTHIHFCSGYGISITDGSNCVVQSNDIDSVGAGGVIVATSTFAADQAALKSSGHQVINNHIYSYALETFLYAAAIDINYAMGTYVAYNKIHDCVHVGILYGGNNNIMEYNEVYDVVKKYTDMGAFYTYGVTRGWGSRGNKLRHNYIHDAPLANGIYLDEFASGDSSSYNIIANVVMATYNHHGYFNTFTNNIYSNTVYPVTCMTQDPSEVQYPSMYGGLKNLWDNSAVYRKAYPECADMVGSSVRNDAYTSRIWPSGTGNVFIANPGVVSSINDHKLFNDDGTTNAAYAQTDPFIKCNLVFSKNIKYLKNLLTPSSPFKVDSLRSAWAFGKAMGQDWHINRMGLHKDLYRTDIASTKIAGIDPILSLRDSGNSNFTNPGTFLLTASVTIPNAENVLSSIRFMENGEEVKGLTLTRNLASFDSVTYTVSWINPYPGDHHLTMMGYDGQYWEYSSNTLDFTVKGPSLPALSVINDPQSACSVDLQWLAGHESNVSTYGVYRSKDSINYSFLFTVNAKCNDGSDCSYSYPLSQNSNERNFYQLLVTGKDGSSIRSNIVQQTVDCSAGKVSQISLYPNPANSQVSLNYSSSKGQSNSQLTVYDVLGRVVLQQTVVVQEGPNQMNVSLTNMTDGVYLLVLEAQHNRLAAQRLIIQH